MSLAALTVFSLCYCYCWQPRSLSAAFPGLNPSSCTCTEHFNSYKQTFPSVYFVQMKVCCDGRGRWKWRLRPRYFYSVIQGSLFLAFSPSFPLFVCRQPAEAHTISHSPVLLKATSSADILVQAQLWCQRVRDMVKTISTCPNIELHHTDTVLRLSFQRERQQSKQSWRPPTQLWFDGFWA